MKIAVVGATGLVGRVMLQVLEESKFPLSELIPVASDRSAGKTVLFQGQQRVVQSLQAALELKPEMAFFSAGSSVSREWAPKFAAIGCYVIDNSSCWRADALVPLVVPEINASGINEHTKIIANPNCSTIQMVLVLSGLHAKYRIKRLVISTYQSVTGTGVKALRQMQAERLGENADMIYPHPIDQNCFPHGGDFLPNGYTTEEEKLVSETRKILSDQSIAITATVVRIPVKGGHSESVNVEFENDFDLADVNSILQSTHGVIVQDDPQHNLYPMPIMAEGKNEVFVGRVRRDFSQANTLNLWIVADNLRKGAATNAIQIGLYIADNLLKNTK